MERRSSLRRAAIALGIGALSLTAFTLGVRAYTADEPSNPEVRHDRPVDVERRGNYTIHKDITATMFWVGEAADESNDFIHNRSSAWIEDWQSAYGGVDDPNNRCGHLPCTFVPQENPFYFALPYNDLDEHGKRKASAKRIPWYNEVIGDNPKSVIKNRWIKITFGDKTAYAQWEDIGPFEYDDFGYVFGTGRPESDRAGIDLSPATAIWLKLDGRGNVSWQFVKESDVPKGPWRETITRSN